ncbi:hypothetical protein HA402_013309 [Bradysia odoriphaga]|nr:hypothetical protein HA402_013309 [Bradysia odoriphaga]
MKTALMVAEKPSLAASLAKILSNGKHTTRKGSNNACSIHEWKGTFKNEATTFKMTSVCGHVMSLDFIGKYNSWDKVDPAELFTCPTEKKEATEKLRMPSFLSQEAKGCTYLILWLDCDKEGENICFEVMDAVSKSIRNVYSDQVTFRAKFSAITDKDIKFAMEHLIRPNENEAKSVDARQEIDLRIGCAFTRFQTKFFQGHYGDLDASLISYGPCQTPTLGFCVQRQDEITNFVPETYWFVQLTAGDPEVTLEWARGRIFKKEIANLFLGLVKKHKDAYVESVTAKEQTKPRPQALNTVELMRAASSGLGLGPHNAMQIAEKLYTQGYISYPRTETTSYPNNFDLISVVNVLKPSSEFGEAAKSILENFNQPRKGTDCGDHPPITPMKLGHRGDFDHDTWRVYDYICRHFLATVSHDLKYKSTTAKLQVGTEHFSCTTAVLIDPGYTKVMTWQAFGADELTPPFKQGESVHINDVKLVERQTGPPDYLTESELITLMEKHGIGTDASIPVHINNICQRNYVTIATGRKLIPTTLGKVLVHGYLKIDPELVLPTMRSDVERLLNLIAQGSAEFNSVLRVSSSYFLQSHLFTNAHHFNALSQHAIEIFRMKFQYFVQNIAQMDSPLRGIIQFDFRFGKSVLPLWKVPSCDETYSLPNNGTIRSYKELRCPLDDFELLVFSSGTKGRSYPVVSVLLQPCTVQGYAEKCCSECEYGTLVLDTTAAPKKWKLGCNSCDVIINFFKGATKVSVDSKSKCDECGSQQVTVLYKNVQSRFKDGADEKTGCVFCSMDFIPLVEKHRAISSRPAQAPTRGRGSRGAAGSMVPSRGGGPIVARGGGNRRGPPKDKMDQLAAYFV